MEKEWWFTILAEFMKAAGRRTNALALVMSFSPMEIATKALTKMANLVAMASTLGAMARSTRGNLTAARKKATDFGKASRAIAIKANGKPIRHMDTVFTLGSKETSMRASGSSASEKDKELISLPTVIFMSESIKMDSLKDRANTSGSIKIPMMVDSKRG